ncbi:uncharacterized protein EDB93DRAFT_1109879 [Suillus bovinus]|uniref:uncharacterized protein n=1 Tax=Suillus bovinus TaxID=48563 RepID=UPI001B872720|nr:uncharacterized protein EDB93DRAFT_1109879 [Suillus bovinus]KAG2126003.1 hypothetical protein EDB93DRAFT_1109879 [Suillus bovinus]
MITDTSTATHHDTQFEVTPVQPPYHRTNRPGAGAGGRNSQLEKIGNTIQTPARAPGKSKIQNVIVPLDEPENMMAPLVTKKGRGKVVPQQLERNLSVMPSLMSMIALVPLRELLVVVLVVVLVVFLMVFLAASLKTPLFMTLRLMESEFRLLVLTLFLMLFLSLSSTSQYMSVDGAEEGNKEVDKEVDFDEDDIYNEGGYFTEDDGTDNNMEYEEGFHGSDDIMHPSDRNN